MPPGPEDGRAGSTTAGLVDRLRVVVRGELPDAGVVEHELSAQRSDGCVIREGAASPGLSGDRASPLAVVCREALRPAPLPDEHELPSTHQSADDAGAVHEDLREGHEPQVAHVAELVRRRRVVVHRHERLGEAALVVEEQQPELAVGRPLQQETELILQIGVGDEGAVGIDTGV